MRPLALVVAALALPAVLLMACASAPKVAPVDAGDVRGEGPPIVLIHGFGDTRGVWKGVAERLAPRFKVYTYDLLGFGGSANSLDVWTADAYAGQLQRFLTVNRIERPVLVGHSMGAQVALTWALRYRTDDDTGARRFPRGVVLIDPSGGAGVTPLFDDDLSALRGACNLLGKPLDEARARAAVDQILGHILADATRHTPAMTEWYLAPLRTWEGRRAVMKVTQDFRVDTMKRFDEVLGGWGFLVQAPEPLPRVLVLWGRQDAWFEVSGLAAYEALAKDHAWHERAPNGFQTLVIEGAGHSPHLEQPGAVANAILEVFADLGATPR